MPVASRSIARLLSRHKSAISSEVETTGVLARLVSKGVLTQEEEGRIGECPTRDDKADALIDIFSRKGFDAFRELCVTLEVESPHLLTSLLLDSQGEMSEETQWKRREPRFKHIFE